MPMLVKPSLFIQFRNPIQEMVLPTIKTGLPISVNIIKISPIGMPRCPSPKK